MACGLTLGEHPYKRSHKKSKNKMSSRHIMLHLDVDYILNFDRKYKEGGTGTPSLEIIFDVTVTVNCKPNVLVKL